MLLGMSQGARNIELEPGKCLFNHGGAPAIPIA